MLINSSKFIPADSLLSSNLFPLNTFISLSSNCFFTMSLFVASFIMRSVNFDVYPTPDIKDDIPLESFILTMPTIFNLSELSYS